MTDRTVVTAAIDAAARERHEQYRAYGGTWVPWELLSDRDRDDYRQEVRWVALDCAGGCGRHLAADRSSVEAGALAFCTACRPDYLPLRLPAD